MRLGVPDRPRRSAARERVQALRDLTFGLMDRGQEHAPGALDRVFEQAAGGDLHRERGFDAAASTLEQRRGTLGQLALGRAQ